MQVIAHVEVTWECPNCTATNEANIFDEGCEVVQYEPMYYLIDDWKPKDELKEILKEDFELFFRARG